MNNSLTTGIGSIKVTKQDDGTYKATAKGLPDVVAPSESAAILRIKDAMQKAVEADEAKQPFRIK